MPAFIDETGNRYGNYTVIERVVNSCKTKTMWKCRCDCGRETFIWAHILRNGNIQAMKKCECQRREILGRQFGDYIVESLDYFNDKKEVVYDCRCAACNTTRIIRKTYLFTKNARCPCSGTQGKNEVGKRYGMLTVISKVEDEKACNGGLMFHCLCDCGNTTIKIGNYLRRGVSTHCGCKDIIDESGNKYGKLLVIRKSENSDNTGRARFECLCDCGKTVEIRGDLLRSGGARSCGCSVAHDPGLAAAKSKYGSYKGMAKKKCRVFNLTLDDFMKITSEPCHYCGMEPVQITHPKNTNGEYVYNGIDRVDNSIGYVKENVVPCCKRCNVAKLNYSVDDFLNWVKRVAEYNNL